ncbi:MAG TPA: hypothetical protein ACYCC8_00860 [Candidatus Azoamicus sp.]
MGKLSYIIILFNNSELFTKISISLIIILFSYITLISINIYLKIKKEEKTLSDINKIIKKNKKNRYIKNNKILIKKKNNTQSYKIYTSGINEFIYLYKKGITDINIIITLVKEIMYIEMINENTYIHKYKIIKNLLIYISFLFFFKFNFIFPTRIYNNISKLKFLNIILKLNELFLPSIISLVIIAKIKIIENIFANLNLKIYNRQKILIKNFLVLLHHKFYE